MIFANSTLLVHLIKEITAENQVILSRYQYPDPGSNRDGSPQRCLRPSRLPIPPSGHHVRGIFPYGTLMRVQRYAFFRNQTSPAPLFWKYNSRRDFGGTRGLPGDYSWWLKNWGSALPHGRRSLGIIELVIKGQKYKIISCRAFYIIHLFKLHKLSGKAQN